MDNVPIEFNIIEKREEIEKQLQYSQEIEDITNTLDVNNMNSLVTFGSKVAEDIAKSSDVILKSMTISQVNNCGDLLATLSRVMSKVDLGEFKDINKKNGLLGNLFKNNIERFLDKYNTIGNEIDKIYITLKEYEAEINNSNKSLESLFNSNINSYRELIKYIMAGKMAIKEIDDYLEKYKIDIEQSQDNMDRFNIQNIQNARSILEQRLQDLKMTEIIAMQSLPMIKSMEFTNFNLNRKINSAFIITIPIFKQTLAQAILLKRQKIQAEGLKALDNKTNEMLLKNARNIVEQAKLASNLAESSSIKIETLEKTWKTILNGIDETRKIQEDARKKFEEDSIKLKKLKGNNV